MDWSAPGAQTAVLAAAGVVLGVVAVLLDPLGRLLVGGAALLLVALAARDRLLRPRLSAGPAGVAVRTLTGTVRLPWPQLRVGVRETRRLGVRSRLLELDTAAGPDDDGMLILLGRRDLGAPPEEVARALQDLASRGGHGRFRP
ncbi:PH domain-containing protein [Geodermatophilus ruber]|uniref:PH domain-containing protein n=1 Tax=Geodermatophilus ruber TaxID=504800 RepID=A0A1I4J8L8_9ACTN|nr:PH domain-containing protein [Geodermatophilus ruber]SFL62890.1 PH domain-containing protein [Geodermatophilus ruber]